MTIDETTYKRMPEYLRSMFVKLPNPGSDEVVGLFPVRGKSTGGCGDASRCWKQGTSYAWEHPEEWDGMGGYGDSGSAARFFYCAKPHRGEREEGLRGFIPCMKCGDKDSLTHVDKEGRTVKCSRNTHPTVKAVALMAYLIRLVSRSGYIILDPFLGSGTTAVACIQTGRHFVGIELNAGYVEIARKRIAEASLQPQLPEIATPDRGKGQLTI
jgi:site-specific DNA-methyltransferase (adenine-specific)